MRSILLFLLLLFLNTNLIYSQSSDSTKVAENFQAQKIQVLEKELETTQKYLDEITDTVYWSLGVLVTIAGLLVGFGWFSNFKVYERDKKALRNELKSLLNQESQELESSLNNRFSEVSNNISENVKEFRENIRNHAEETIKEESETLKQKVKSLNNSIEYLKRLNKQRKLESYKAERRYWELKEVEQNEMSLYRQILKLAIELNDETEISYALQGIRELYKKGIDSGPAFEPVLMKLLENLPSKYSEEVASIKSMIRKSKEA
ncbi:hypothetical protein [Fodinibius sp. Rm-B-1B1-1]|uniref:hypothetical protein n=1 Tax=Fodinibius alkaliphilus TaxID=3140241 RepID=UPI00315ABFE7